MCTKRKLFRRIFIICLFTITFGSVRRRHHYSLTLSIRNHNITEAEYFRLYGAGHTVDFDLKPGAVFTRTYQVWKKGFWVLLVEFPEDQYAKSPRKIISRDSHSHWVMEIYYYPGAVGFSDWHKIT